MKKNLKYHHLGIPTDIPQPDEFYLEEFKMWTSGYETSPYGIEWLRFAEGCPLPEIVQKIPHVAFVVEDLAAAIEGEEVLISPNSPSEGVTVAFILHNGAPIELLEFEGPEYEI
jgi:hypothetical protein